jgi:hypothetical protein
MFIERDGHFMRPMRLHRRMPALIAPMRQSPACRPAAKPSTSDDGQREAPREALLKGEFEEFVATPRTDACRLTDSATLLNVFSSHVEGPAPAAAFRALVGRCDRETSKLEQCS